jgi:hypothetical protein
LVRLLAIIWALKDKIMVITANTIDHTTLERLVEVEAGAVHGTEVITHSGGGNCQGSCHTKG